MIQENSSNRQENIVAGDNSQLQFLSAVEEFKRAETDEEKAVAIEAMRIVAKIHGVGITPDVIVEFKESDLDGKYVVNDRQLQEAVKILKDQKKRAK